MTSPQQQLQRASDIVGRYREVIERLAEELADKSEIGGDVVTKAVREHGAHVIELERHLKLG